MSNGVAMRSEITTAVVAAAGSATRMWPASKIVPKELFPLGRFPVVLHLVAELVSAGIQRIALVVAPQNIQMMRSLFDRSIAPPRNIANGPAAQEFDRLLDLVEITIIPQGGGYGNATPLVTAADYVGTEACVYAFGDDVVFGENVTEGLLNTFRSTGRPVLAAQEVEPSRRSLFGIIETHREGSALVIDRLIEKPSGVETTSNLASFGRYIVTADLIQTLLTIGPGRDGELWFVDSVIRQISRGDKIYAFPLTTGEWYTVGDPRGYGRALAAATELTLMPPSPTPDAQLVYY